MFSDKGYGFISRSDGAGDTFVHISAVVKSGLRALRQGDVVQYNIVAGRAGRTEAADIRFIERAAA
jgi:CspA family cold shock protein